MADFSPYKGPPPRSGRALAPVMGTRVKPDWPLIALCWIVAVTGYMAGDRLGFANASAHEWTLASTGVLVLGIASAVMLVISVAFCLDPKGAGVDRRIGTAFLVLSSSFIIGLSMGSVVA